MSLATSPQGAICSSMEVGLIGLLALAAGAWLREPAAALLLVALTVVLFLLSGASPPCGDRVPLSDDV